METETLSYLTVESSIEDPDVFLEAFMRFLRKEVIHLSEIIFADLAQYNTIYRDRFYKAGFAVEFFSDKPLRAIFWNANFLNYLENKETVRCIRYKLPSKTI
jgi:hypothetical protein